MANRTDIFQNLPGSVIDLQDGVRNMTIKEVEGKKVVLLGTAVDGPAMEPVTVSDFDQVEEIFGGYTLANGQPSGATLVVGARRALQAGAKNLTLIRISGEDAEGEIPLRSYINMEERNNKQYFGEARGNEETEVDLLSDLPLDDNRLDYVVENVQVYVGGELLSSNRYQLSSQHGTLIIREDVTDSLADLIVEYDMVRINFLNIGYQDYSQTITGDGASEEFTLDQPYGKILDKVYAEDKEYKVLNYKTTDEREDGVYISGFDIEDKPLLKFNEAPEELLEVTIEFKSASIVGAEEPTKTSSTTNTEFVLYYENVLKENETIIRENSEGDRTLLHREDEFDDESGDTYTFDYEEGIIRTNLPVNSDEGERIFVSYKYEQRSSEFITYEGEVEGREIELILNHQINTNRPVVVLADDEQIQESQFEIIEESDFGKSSVKLSKGSVEKGQVIEVTYFYSEEDLVNPSIELKSLYPSTVYNKVRVFIEDEFFQDSSILNLEDIDVDLTYVGSTTVEEEERQVYRVPDNIDYKGMNIPFRTTEESGTLIFDDNKITLVSNDEIQDFTINYEEGTFICNVEEGSNVSATALKLRTPRLRFSISLGEQLSRIEGKRYEFLNENIVKNLNPLTVDPVKLAVESSSGGEDVLTSGQFEVDYASGTVTLDDSVVVSPGDVLVAKYYSYYNIRGQKMTIRKPREKTSEDESRELTYSLGTDLNTIGELAKEINQDPRNNVVRIELESDLYSLPYDAILTNEEKIQGNVLQDNFAQRTITLRGGRDEIDLTKDEIYIKLGGLTNEEGIKTEVGAYDILYDYEPADIVIPLGVYADDRLSASYQNFANQLAQSLAKCFFTSNEIRGVIGVKPLERPTRKGLIDRVNNLSSLQTLFFLQDDRGNIVTDKENNPVDVGKYISIVSHDITYQDRRLGVPQVANGAIEYGSVLSQLDKGNAPTNEIINGQLAYTYSRNKANILSGNRMVTFKQAGGSAKITDGIVCAFPGSGWTRYLTVDIVFDVMDEVRAVFDKYIGKGNSPAHRASLDSDIRRTLDEDSTLRDFDFDLHMSDADELMGRMVVELDLVPLGELRKIQAVVSINQQL